MREDIENKIKELKEIARLKEEALKYILFVSESAIFAAQYANLKDKLNLPEYNLN